MCFGNGTASIMVQNCHKACLKNVSSGRTELRHSGDGGAPSGRTLTGWAASTHRSTQRAFQTRRSDSYSTAWRKTKMASHPDCSQAGIHRSCSHRRPWQSMRTGAVGASTPSTPYRGDGWKLTKSNAWNDRPPARPGIAFLSLGGVIRVWQRGCKGR